MGLSKHFLFLVTTAELGSGTFLYLEKDGDPLVVEAQGDTNIKFGDTIKVGFEAPKCHLFDSNNKAFR